MQAIDWSRLNVPRKEIVYMEMTGETLTIKLNVRIYYIMDGWNGSIYYIYIQYSINLLHFYRMVQYNCGTYAGNARAFTAAEIL